jgi:hypothetical protein
VKRCLLELLTSLYPLDVGWQAILESSARTTTLSRVDRERRFFPLVRCVQRL